MSTIERRVFKYELATDTVLELPQGAKPLCVAEQDRTYQVWFEIPIVNDSVPLVRHHLSIYPTGFLAVQDPELSYLGTIFSVTGLVWHVYHRVAS